MNKFFLDILSPLGIHELTPIQESCLEEYNQHDEIILYAPTGTGKTLAFILPLVQLLTQDKTQGQQVLIISPTRELALQIESVFKSLKSSISISACYGGHSLSSEINNLSANPTVIIGTPGRILDHIERKTIHIETIRYFVFDEFDKCLELGFQEEIASIYGETRALKKMFFGSATKLNNFPVFIRLNNPIIIDKTNQDVQPEFSYFQLPVIGDKPNTISKLIPHFKHEKSMCFCNFREDVELVHRYLLQQKIASVAYHGGMEQDERERAIIKFRNGSASVLVCTDIGSRGLDISDVKHIVHFMLPDKLDAFVHRNGRTSRMKESGSVYFFDTDLKNVNFELPKSSEFRINQTLPYEPPLWKTIYFSAGKKNKINKIDLVGYLCKQADVSKNEIGNITVLDYTSFVALPISKANAIISKLKGTKIKGQKLKISPAY